MNVVTVCLCVCVFMCVRVCVCVYLCVCFKLFCSMALILIFCCNSDRFQWVSVSFSVLFSSFCFLFIIVILIVNSHSTKHHFKYHLFLFGFVWFSFRFVLSRNRVDLCCIFFSFCCRFPCCLAVIVDCGERMCECVCVRVCI